MVSKVAAPQAQYQPTASKSDDFVKSHLAQSPSCPFVLLPPVPVLINSECWGHRGASARFPENTMASFEAAIRDGVDGIESDVHVSQDNVIVMFHDPTLSRTTDYTGEIKNRNWYGQDGMEHARTKKEPKQAIPTFPETLALLMKPENMHIMLDIDVKPTNDPEKLFSLMHASISAFPEWQTTLAPRILLGLWHPKFLRPAKAILPYCKRSSISFSLRLARTHLWDEVDCVSIWFNTLMTANGLRFYHEAKQSGKKVMVFTVNEPAHMIEMVRLKVDAIITDYPNRYLDLRSGLEKNYESMLLRFNSPWTLWTTWHFYWPIIAFVQWLSENTEVTVVTSNLRACSSSRVVARMSSWYSRWLPGLPSIPLPSSIQRKVLSFILRKSLGHLLQPGQLDVDQIDSQIGSGYVQVNELQLNHDAINASLAGLPVELTAGTISSVTTRIPWPNPLTSTIGLSIDGLDLTFHVAQPKDASSFSQNLAESVVSVADSFIHGELTPREEATLRESFHPDLAGDVPGGLDPFLSTPEQEEFHSDDDPAGVSLFASLIERLLARFEFDASNTTISIVHAERVCFTAHIPKIEYATVENTDATSTRTITISGFSLTAHDLHPFMEEPEAIDSRSVNTTSRSRSRSPSPASSSSSLDEQAQFAMSQSLAFLPPRPVSPASSVASSMYQSAISENPNEQAASVPDTASSSPSGKSPRARSLEPEVILAFSGEPLKISLAIPDRAGNMSSNPPVVREVVKLTVEMGSIGCALSAWHIQEAIALSTALVKSLPSNNHRPSSSADTGSGPVMAITLSLRSIVLLLLPAPIEGAMPQPLSEFFSRPLLPPKLPQSYVRVHLDVIRASVSPLPWTMMFSMGEISAFVLQGPDSASASPLLITDHGLNTHYSTSHIHPDLTPQAEEPHIPHFTVVDWTDPKQQRAGIKVSQWRNKVQAPRSKGLPDHHAVSGPSVALDLIMRKSNSAQTPLDIEANLQPLHVFLDLDLVGGLRDFVEVVANQIPISTPSDSPSHSEEDTPPTTPHPNYGNSVLEDLNADSKVETSNRINIKLQMLRIQLRCPPPPDKDVRSGALVVDFHDVHATADSGSKKPVVRFVPTEPESSTLASIRTNRIVVASSLAGDTKAIAILSIGPLSSNDAESPLLPCLSLSQPVNAKGPIISLNVPSIYAHISKPQLDSLQYLVDDCSQLAERLSGKNVEDSDTVKSMDTSIIGSRFFVKSRTGSGSAVSADNRSDGLLVKVGISEALVRIILADKASATLRPFNIKASDVEVLVQSKPGGKDESLITLTARELDINQSAVAGSTETLLSLTTPRGLTSSPRPLLKFTFSSLILPGTTAKESKIRATLWGFTFNLSPNIQWISDLGHLVKPPPGAFESVVPTEKTHISLKVLDGSIRLIATSHPGALVLHIGALGFSTSLVGGSTDLSLQLSLSNLAALMVDDLADTVAISAHKYTGLQLWNKSGYALLSEISHLDVKLNTRSPSNPPQTRVLVERVGLALHLCADSLSSVSAFAKDLADAFKPPSDPEANSSAPQTKAPPAVVSPPPSTEILLASVDDIAFNRVPEVGPPPDMINDDLPTNMDYLDDSFGAAAGLRELVEEDMEDFDVDDASFDTKDAPGVVSKVGGETIKMLRPEGLRIIEHHFDTLPPETTDIASQLGVIVTQVRVHNADINLLLYDGYDWVRTRRTIEDEVRQMRRRLAKIRQLVAGGQTQDPSFEETGALLFNSVYIGLNQDADEFEPAALIAAIDEELKDDLETASQSSWQSLRPSSGNQPRARSTKVHGKRLTRAKAPSVEFQIMGLDAEVDQYRPEENIVSRTFVTVKDLEILDRMSTSTWNKFLSEMRSDSRGNVRETDSNMVRVELRSVKPVPGHDSEEARLKAKILPLRLYVDQDALDFLKKFFSFKDPQASPPQEGDSSGDIYFQLAEIFPVDLKLDYKPRRVDYRALREGRTIELMNFFHFDGAEMTLRHITLSGITGWPRLFDLLNDIWTPDVKATQLVDVISGVAPIRSVVNVGSGVADLVLLPIAQYKKDGRIVRGVQKGATAFLKSTAVEAIKLGARLATGTQVILEQAEDVLGGQFKDPVTTEAVQPISADYVVESQSDEEEDEDMHDDLFSKYAEQPADLREGVQSAYKSLQRNLHSAAQTILAVPMEVYERSGTEGPVRAVVRAVPIAVLKSGIGVTEAVSKTMLGLHNTLQPDIRQENEAKYKQKHRS
ncbi:GP-PDE domain-containing protein [Mycena indigotica]|uniref:Autophagy-related protein 2 n=1 Tax=Mycena indigotica TaxID=2126181 RepID=A0A8H6S8D0_9AGAR|nr:GP-PDE domain-containing protein [Mycena indigotica]KAF7294875.1 GP-PDE domain-containing protein [Mycena indigotica]